MNVCGQVITVLLHCGTITHNNLFLHIFRRVHVTPATLEHLRGEYEVEPGNGHLRNEHIGSLGNFELQLFHIIFFKYGVLLRKLFWPTVRKNSSSDRETLLKFEAEGREFAKFLRLLEQLFWPFTVLQIKIAHSRT